LKTNNCRFFAAMKIAAMDALSVRVRPLVVAPIVVSA
jgi:hypothetical protein